MNKTTDAETVNSSVIKGRIEATSIFDCNSIDTFINSIVQRFSHKGYSGAGFYLCEINGVRFLTKLCFYFKTPYELYSANKSTNISQTDAEIEILRLFKKELIDENITPCILEMVYEKKCYSVFKLSLPGYECERLLMRYERFSSGDDIRQLMCWYKDRVVNKLAHDKIAYIVLEKCDITFDDYIIKSEESPISNAIFKSLLFMIIYTFYVLKKKYPKFIHRDLHTENVMLKYDPGFTVGVLEPKFLVFNDGDTRAPRKFNVPYFGIIPKIIDFGFSSLPERGIVSNIEDDKSQMFLRSSHDMVFLFYHIYSTLSLHNNERLKTVDAILSKLEPHRSYVHHYPEYIRKIENELPTYANMINNEIFAEYTNFVVPAENIIHEYFSA